MPSWLTDGAKWLSANAGNIGNAALNGIITIGGVVVGGAGMEIAGLGVVVACGTVVLCEVSAPAIALGSLVTAAGASIATYGIKNLYNDVTKMADESGEPGSGSGGQCGGGDSFVPGTRVLLADGRARPISSLKSGDKVLATNTKTGKTQPETITAVEVNHDTDLYDLTVKTSNGTEVIHTTSSHLFWDPYPHYGWIPAKHLKPGMHLKTPDGQSAVVVGGSVPAVHDGWMWDLTVPGNNDHDFYVVAASGTGSLLLAPEDEALLVHNDDGPVGTVFRSGAYRFQIYSNDHGPAHGHLIGPDIGGDGIQIGQNGKPLDPNITLTPAQQKVIDDNLGTIRNAIRKYMAWYRNCG